MPTKWIVTRRVERIYKAEVEVEADCADDAIAMANEEVASDLTWREVGDYEETAIARQATS